MKTINSKLRFFAYDGEGEIVFFETLEEAQKKAESSLKAAREYAADYGFDDGRHLEICFGEIHGQVFETDRKIRPDASKLDEDSMDENGTYWGHEFDEIINVELLKIENK